MKEYEIHISASYITEGKTKEWTYFKEYVMGESARAAKRELKKRLCRQGYKNISLEAYQV